MQGFLEVGDQEIADFHFELGKANHRATRLRKAAAGWEKARRKGSVSKERQRWKELHETAARCFECVFGDAADVVEECLAASPPDSELWVRQQHSGLTVPWGLLCTPSDATVAEASPPQILLWSAKYNLRTTFQHGRSSRKRAEGWRFEPVLCDKTYAADTRGLCPEAVPLARAILARSRNPRLLQGEPELSSNCFLYVHSHASRRGDLVFRRGRGGGAFKCDPIDIVKGIVPLDSGAAVFAVLNACETAIGFKSAGLSLVTESGTIELACLATEIPLERRFAIEFGLELIDLCVQQGESTYAAMKALRRKHYPLSIAYSHFCKADFVTKGSVPVFHGCDLEAYRASAQAANYSYRQRR